jgi:site-specific DNA recombinase
LKNFCTFTYFNGGGQTGGVDMFAQTKNTYLRGNYKVGIYVRLSREDDGALESESIQNQKDYLIQYVIQKGWSLFNVYSDDGYSGTNFDRPGFIRLIKDIENGKVNLVITKDLSRLGRDYIGTGYYLEKFFPEKNVRYMAVNDGIDTFSNDSNNDMNPFRSVINDMYAKDISRKVRSVVDQKRRDGKYIGAFAPYGYRKSDQDKNKLIIDEEAAEIVRKIFQMYLNGFGFSKIADILNEDLVLPPGIYKKTKTPSYNNQKLKLGLWTQETVRSILINPTYSGNLAQYKYTKINYKVNKLRTNPKENWIVVENTHNAIISNEDFLAVQRLIESKCNKDCRGKKANHLLTGLLFCGDCGERLTFTKTSKGEGYCICSKYKRFKKCTRHSYNERKLEEVVLGDLGKLIDLAVDKDKLFNISGNKKLKVKSQDTNLVLIETIDRRLNEIKKAIKQLYEDKIKHVISEEDFTDILKEFNIEREQLTRKLKELGKSGNIKCNEPSETSKVSDMVNQLINFKKINNLQLSQLINKIEVFEGKRIKVHYNFTSPFL